jgi:hypothetical protein
MNRRISDREWRDLSAYLDGQLSPKQTTRLEKTLQGRAELRAALEDLEKTRAILRSQPRLRAPRNFTLNAEVLGVQRRQRPARQPAFAFGFASALASVMLVIVIAGEFLFGGQQMVASPVAMEAEFVEITAPQLTAPETAPAEAPAELRAAPEELPAVTEAVEISQEAAEVTSKSIPPGATAELGIMEYPAPLAADAQAPAIQPQTATPLPEASPVPTQAVPQVTAAISMAEPEQIGEQSEPIQATPLREPTFWNGWRVAQAVLLFAALASAVLALYLRRTAAK